LFAKRRFYGSRHGVRAIAHCAADSPRTTFYVGCEFGRLLIQFIVI
jgi:hypothetical protein